MRLPKGFKAGGKAAGIKLSGQPDLALIHSPLALRWAVMTTTNALKAPFIDRNRALFGSGSSVRAVLVNSGNANCATGDEGVKNNEALAAETAAALGINLEEVLTASTGIVGHQLPLARIRQQLPALAQDLGDEADAAAKAIMTTDLRPKLAEKTLKGGARVVGIAKGSGMIHPNMATMLAFVMTDADMSQEALKKLWPEVVNDSFNQVTVDGDTSPNDMALVLSSAQVQADAGELKEALLEVCQSLAKGIARDGEGATKLLTVRVTGAGSSEEARQAARTVARSPLVKSAAHGNDPNWGRILVALGYSGVPMDPARVSIRIQGTLVYRGLPQAFDEAALSQAMNAEDLILEADLGAGMGSGSAWGCDLSADYVRINADYST